MSCVRLTVFLFAWLAVLVGRSMGEQNALTLVDNGRAATVIVIPDEPLPVHRFAAEELQYHVEQSSGAKLTIHHERDAKNDAVGGVFLGPCRHTAGRGIDAEGLPPNGFRITLAAGNLHLIGDDGDGPVIEANGIGSLHNNRTHVGTLFAVYEFLEKHLGVRWLWPGAAGDVIPKHRTITVKRWEQTHKPQLLHVRWRDYGFRYHNGWNSQAAARQHTLDVARWMRRQRAALGVDMDASHAYTNWWEKYGNEHPEWFALRPGGQRGPGGNPRFVQMCVSQPGLWTEIVKRWKKKLQPEPAKSPTDRDSVPIGPSLSPFIDISENDSDGSTLPCTCKSCRAWDGLGEHLSDRYAKFWLAVQREAESIRPDARLITIAYDRYFLPPKQTKLNDRVLIGIVPGFYFPWSNDHRQQFREQWQGWSDTGAGLFLRPNWLHFGHNFPFNFARQLGEDFRFAHARGMIATDFDLVPAPWATQGLTYYLLARIHRHPDWPVDKIFQEYYDGFGPARKQVQAYFEHWEQMTGAITREHYEQGHTSRGIGDNAEHKLYVWGNFFFTLEVMARGKSLLERAKAAAVNDQVAKRRVAFLEMGFRDVELTLATQAAFERYKKAADANAYVDALDRLDAHRAASEPHNVAGMGWLRYKEPSWNRSAARKLSR